MESLYVHLQFSNGKASGSSLNRRMCGVNQSLMWNIYSTLVLPFVCSRRENLANFTSSPPTYLLQLYFLCTHLPEILIFTWVWDLCFIFLLKKYWNWFCPIFSYPCCLMLLNVFKSHTWQSFEKLCFMFFSQFSLNFERDDWKFR